MTALCLLLVVGMSLSLTRQGVEHLRLLRSQPTDQASAPLASTRQHPSPEQLQNLFGLPAEARSEQAAPPTRQQLTLLASFVNPDARRSAAIIQIAGAQPKRIEVGDEVNASTRLHAVHPDRVVLERNGRQESLSFPAIRPLSSSAPSYSPQSFDTQQLEQLQSDEVQALQERMATLQQRLEGTDEQSAPTLSPEAEDTP
ncbi:type II secretion system protein N [Pseudomonas sp. CAU 1711]|uniref:type II secretion system protein N n=1 Tax=Pseudomonas sp. CAU 1711 TaxID=3140356 RepID=UPI0032612CA2